MPVSQELQILMGSKIRQHESNYHIFYYIEDVCLFFVKDQNLFDRVDTIGNIFTSGAAIRENITDGVHELK